MRLATDASSCTWGWCSDFPHPPKKPIAYASRTLSASECNYAKIEKEALGRFHQYLYGRKFILTSKPLTSIFGPKKGVPALAATRLQRWAIQLSAYDNEIEFRATDKHGNADSLSRLPLPEISPEEGVDVKVLQIYQLESLPITCEHVKKAVQKDTILRKVLQYSRQGWPDTYPREMQPYFIRREEISIENQCLLWGSRVLIPTSHQILADLHREHPGISNMKALARGGLS